MLKYFLIPLLVLSGLAAGIWQLYPTESQAAGLILYVDKDTACPGNGSSATPYCSIQNAFNVVNAGDTIRIRNSAVPYDEAATLTRSGTSASPIIIEPDIGHTPIIRRTNQNAFEGGISIYNASHITVQNLTFDCAGVNNCSRVGLLLRTTTTNMSGLKVLNNIFKNWGGDAATASVVSADGFPRGALIVASGYWFSPPTLEIRGTLIRGNSFQNNRQSGITTLYGPDTVIENNTITGTTCGHDTDTARNTMGIKLIACQFSAGCNTNITVRNNVIHDFEPMGSCQVAHTEGSFDTPAGIWCDVGLYNNLVEGNVIYNISQTDTGQPAYVDSAGVYIEHNCKNWTVRNNIIHDIGHNGIKIRIADQTGATSNYVNNTIYNTNRGIYIFDGPGVFKNNIVKNSRIASIVAAFNHPFSLYDFNNNLYHNSGGALIANWGGTAMNFATWKSTSGKDANSLNLDPLLANPAGGDFHLTASSPAINAGTTLTAVTTDFEGTTRPQGAAYDIGADEFGGAGPTSTPTPTPTPSTSATVSFVTTNTTTQGTWKSLYGSEGYQVISDSQSLPTYAQITPTGNSSFTWSPSTTDVRALQKGGTATDRIASTWYNDSSFNVNVNLTDTNMHQVALYFLDWDSTARAQTVEVLDAATNAVLDTRSLSSFNQGMYLVWNIKGNVTFRFTRTGSSNAVLSGIFLGSASSPTPTPTPTPGPVACSQYTPSSTIPTGYASPYDVVSSPSTNLMNVTCDVSSARVDLGKGDPLQYIYNQGYLFKTGGTSWTPVPYTSAESLIAGAWYPKTATTNISLTSTELAQPSYNLAYLCTWTGSGWKCGCRDASCTQSYWQIQSFKR